MTKKIVLALFLLLGFPLLAWQSSTILAAPSLQTGTATPEATAEPEEEPTLEATDELTATVAEPTLAELAAQVAALQAQVDALSAYDEAAVANEVTTAVYLLDTAGLHDLDVRLNEEGVIEASDAGTVARLVRLLSSVDWPESLAADAANVTDLLTQLADALSNDDVESAAALATQVHETGHDLSHAAEHWLGELTVPSGEYATAGQAFRVTSAIYLLDTAGLHDLDVRLNEEGVIEASDAGTVARLVRLLSSVDWPESLAADAANVTDLLAQLADALSNDDVESAAPLATQVHETGHDLSHAAEHWLSGSADAHGHGEDESTEDDAGDEHGDGEGEDHHDTEEGGESSENAGG